jgi:hypothetical protein
MPPITITPRAERPYHRIRCYTCGLQAGRLPSVIPKCAKALSEAHQIPRLQRPQPHSWSLRDLKAPLVRRIGSRSRVRVRFSADDGDGIAGPSNSHKPVSNHASLTSPTSFHAVRARVPDLYEFSRVPIGSVTQRARDLLVPRIDSTLGQRLSDYGRLLSAAGNGLHRLSYDLRPIKWTGPRRLSQQIHIYLILL